MSLRNLARFLTMWSPGNIQIARAALGKYIIGFASLLHLVWATIILFDDRAMKATPVAIIANLCQGDKILVVFVLMTVAALAITFLDFRMRKLFHITALSMLLLPQQFILWCSAFAGVYATIVGQYADGVPRAWAHILSDQMPCILMALLYTVALIETRHLPPMLIENEVSKGTKGDTGATGATGAIGETGPAGPTGPTGASA